MKDIITKSLLFGLGAASASKKELERTIKDFEKSKVLTKKQANELMKTVQKQLDAHHKELRKHVEKESKRIEQTMKSLVKDYEAEGKKQAKALLKRAEKALK